MSRCRFPSKISVGVTSVVKSLLDMDGEVKRLKAVLSFSWKDFLIDLGDM